MFISSGGRLYGPKSNHCCVLFKMNPTNTEPKNLIKGAAKL